MNSSQSLPVLYSFRRCPYAMRARLALAYAGITVELREILLKDKPAEMLTLSPKGTVPVLQLSDGRIIDESIDVMFWALEQHDPDAWLDADPQLTGQLIEQNDGPFKLALDQYKYFTRFPEQPREHYREQGESFLQTLETCLAQQNGKWLTRSSCALADIAIFPFIRQFAGADPAWFQQAPYPLVQTWLDGLVDSTLFKQVMSKYPPWQASDSPTLECWQRP